MSTLFLQELYSHFRFIFKIQIKLLFQTWWKQETIIFQTSYCYDQRRADYSLHIYIILEPKEEMSSRIYMLRSTIEEAKFRFRQTEQSSLDNEKRAISTTLPGRRGGRVQRHPRAPSEWRPWRGRCWQREQSESPPWSMTRWRLWLDAKTENTCNWIRSQ